MILETNSKKQKYSRKQGTESNENKPVDSITELKLEKKRGSGYKEERGPSF